MGGKGVDWIDLDQGQESGCCEHGNEPSLFMRYCEIFGLDEEMLGSQGRPCSIKLAIEFVNKL